MLPVFRRSIREFFGAYRKTGAKGRGIIERDPSILPAIFRAGPTKPPPDYKSFSSVSPDRPPPARPSSKQTTPRFSRRDKSCGERATTRVPEKRVPTESKGLKIPRTPRPPSPIRRKGAIPGNPQKSLKPSLAKDSSTAWNCWTGAKVEGEERKGMPPSETILEEILSTGKQLARQWIFAPAATSVSLGSRNDPRRISHP